MSALPERRERLVETLLARFDAVFEGVEWRAGGERRLRAPCPLHGGDGPSLSVDRRTGAWTCHSRQCHGPGAAADVLAWIAYSRGIAEPGAPLAGDAFRRTLEEAERIAGLPEGKARLLARPRARRRLASDARPAAPPQGVQRLWSVALPLEGTPAARYLCDTRLVWPPERPFPPSVRWVPREALPRQLGSPPRDAAGTIVYAFGPPAGGESDALQLDALTAAGERTSERWRRALGPTSGRVFRVDGRAAQGALALCEGPLTALALALRSDVGEARATGGTAGMRPTAAAGWEGLVRLYPDADEVGRRAARQLARSLGQTRRVQLVEHAGVAGEDEADRLAAAVREHGWERTLTTLAALVHGAHCPECGQRFDGDTAAAAVEAVAVHCQTVHGGELVMNAPGWENPL